MRLEEMLFVPLLLLLLLLLHALCCLSSELLSSPHHHHHHHHSMFKSSQVSSFVSHSEEHDPERQLKLKECCDLLLAGGYFRARLATLSPFDKVVGGLVWSITASGVDVDVDIIFQENSTIGQRIKLSDQIIKALVAMKAPKIPQPQQIQGLDYDHLFPVIQWLVRHVIETRRLTGDMNKLYAAAQFNKNYQLPEQYRSSEANSYIASVLNQYKPHRLFRQKQGAQFDSIQSKTDATLLEYGEKLLFSAQKDEEINKTSSNKQRSSLIGKFDPSQSAAALEQKQKESEEAQKAAELAQEKHIKSLEDQLSAADQLNKVSGANVGNIVGLNAEEIRKAQAEYERKQKLLQESDENSWMKSKKGQEAQHSKQLELLRKKLTAQQEILTKKQADYGVLDGKINDQRAELEKKQAYINRIYREIAKLDVIEQNSGNVAVLNELRSLVFTNESLKLQESQFKSNCIAQRSELLAEIKQLENNLDSNSEENAKFKAIEAMYSADANKLNALRLNLAQVNQQINKFSRAIDEIPTRAELLQYERRFVELYELIANKLIETKKYYSLYNTLNENYDYLNNQSNLLKSIIENFPLVIKQSNGSNAFQASINKAVEAIKLQQEQAKQSLQVQEKNKEKQLSAYNDLIEKQRNYFKALKEFQEECNKNEKLLALAQHQGESKEEQQ
jgi:hypothetical protein